MNILIHCYLSLSFTHFSHFTYRLQLGWIATRRVWIRWEPLLPRFPFVEGTLLSLLLVQSGKAASTFLTLNNESLTVDNGSCLGLFRFTISGKNRQHGRRMWCVRMPQPHFTILGTLCMVLKVCSNHSTSGKSTAVTNIIYQSLSKTN